MLAIETLINEIVEKRQRIKVLAEQSPEAAEAAQLGEECARLQAAIVEQSRERTIQYIPYPAVYPYPTFYQTLTVDNTGNSRENTIDWTYNLGTTLQPGTYILKG